MILVDTAIWIDHFHDAEPDLLELLEGSLVSVHPMIIGELALGSIRNRTQILELLDGLESLPTATHDEVLGLVEAHRLYGRGLSLVDACLLASLRLSPDAQLWTRDRRLRSAATMLNIAVMIEKRPDEVPEPDQ